jgi:hypothetical protein
MEAAASITKTFDIQPLPVSGQHDVGCGHEPKRVVTHKRNVDEYRNDCEQGDNKRNDMDTENVEHCNSRGHSCYLPKTFAGAKVFLIRQELQSKTDC